jgi:anti-sigma B factor antagonist
MQLGMREYDRDGVRVIAVGGEIDIATAPQLSTRLNVAVRCSAGGVVVDLSGVELIDSTGIAVLLNALRRMTRSRRRLALVCPGGPVRRALRLARLESTFLVRESLADAIDAARPQTPRPAVA